MAPRARALTALLAPLALLACSGGEPAPSGPPAPVAPVGKPPRKSPPKDPVGGFSIQLPTLTLAPEIIPPSRPSGEVLREPGEESSVARLSRQYGLAAVEGLWMDPAAMPASA